jgi:hypothetical protein
VERSSDGGPRGEFCWQAALDQPYIAIVVMQVRSGKSIPSATSDGTARAMVDPKSRAKRHSRQISGPEGLSWTNSKLSDYRLPEWNIDRPKTGESRHVNH